MPAIPTCLFMSKVISLGSTWRDNIYPGLSCEIPSYWYSYSFEPNPDWSYRFSYAQKFWTTLIMLLKNTMPNRISFTAAQAA